MKIQQSVKKVCAVSVAAIALIFWAAQREPDINSLSDDEVSSRLDALRKQLTPPEDTLVNKVAAVYGRPYSTGFVTKGVPNGREIRMLTDWRQNRHIFLWFRETNGGAWNFIFSERPIVVTREYARRGQVPNGLKQAPPVRVVTPQMIAAQKQAEKARHLWLLAENRKDLKTLMAVERRFGRSAREQNWGTTR